MDPDTSDTSDPWRWTLAEYLLRCEFGTDLREVLVEGGLDREICCDALKRWGATGVTVIDASYFRVSSEESIAAGYNSGAKGSLLTIADALRDLKQRTNVAAATTIVIDQDYDNEISSEDGCVLVTDGHSIESYAFSIEALDRFVRLALGRAPAPAGAGAKCPSSDRRTCTGEDLYSRLESASAEIAAVRLVLRSMPSPLAFFDNWLSYVSVSPDGKLVTRAEALLKNILANANRLQEMAAAKQKLPREMERSLADVFRWVRGHDFISLLGKLLRSSWGKPIAGIFARASDTVLARTILSLVDPGQLDSYPLFVELRARFA